MNTQPLGLEERRSRVAAAHEALEGLADVLHQATGPELGELMTAIDGVAAQAAAARVTITVEAVNRGQVAEEGVNAHGWVRAHAPSLRQGGAGDVAKVAAAVTPPPSQWRPEGSSVDPDSPLGIVWDAVSAGTVSPALASATLRELERVEPMLTERAKPTVTRLMLELGRDWGPAQMRRLRPRLLAEYGRSGVLDDLQERLAPAARLSAPFVESGDLTEYQLLMTPEQATALEAAIGALSAPAPNDETGERDLRPAGQRRVEALTEVCRRSSSADVDAMGGADGAAGSASAVHVIIPLADLEARTGFGEVVGSTATGTVLSPEVLRRISCEAELVPHVLGTAGEDLDLGRVVRLFTRAQRRLVTGAPCRALGRWWALGHRQRSPALPAPPHRGPQAAAHRPGAAQARCAGAVRRVGPHRGQLRPPPRTPSSRGGRERPPTAHTGTTARAGRCHQV
jgi:hypothetical protein